MHGSISRASGWNGMTVMSDHERPDDRPRPTEEEEWLRLLRKAAAEAELHKALDKRPRGS